MSFCKIIGFTKRIYHFYKIIGFTKRIYHSYRIIGFIAWIYKFLPPSASDNNAEIEGQLRHHSVVGNQAGAPRARTPNVQYEAGLTTAARRVLQQYGFCSGNSKITLHIWAHMGPYGPIYGPIWAHVGPYGSSWTGLGIP